MDVRQWDKLHDAIFAIYRQQQRTMSFAELYEYGSAPAQHAARRVGP